MSTLISRRVVLRPLVREDFPAWSEVRQRNCDWLVKWEPASLAGAPDPVRDRAAFAARCGARDRERQLGTSHGFGLFVDGFFAGELNLSIVQRGPFQSAYLGYWIDQARAGQGYMPEALVLLCQHAFEQLNLHRIQISIIPRNLASRRVTEKLEIRDEGVALRYLEINGIWEDHIRFAITSEEWVDRRDALAATWID
ncbi:MAG: N-acetyltransferase [Acidimicrobiia bacterium]|nr:N-acetyltransferase [Acidimicrobiia bacterium]